MHADHIRELRSKPVRHHLAPASTDLAPTRDTLRQWGREHHHQPQAWTSTRRPDRRRDRDSGARRPVIRCLTTKYRNHDPRRRQQGRARRKLSSCRGVPDGWRTTPSLLVRRGVQRAPGSTIRRRPGPSCGRNCSERPGRGRRIRVPRGMVPRWLIPAPQWPMKVPHRFMRARPIRTQASSTSTNCDGSEPVNAPPPPESVASPNRAESAKVLVIDPVPKAATATRTRLMILRRPTDTPVATASSPGWRELRSPRHQICSICPFLAF